MTRFIYKSNWIHLLQVHLNNSLVCWRNCSHGIRWKTGVDRHDTEDKRGRNVTIDTHIQVAHEMQVKFIFITGSACAIQHNKRWQAKPGMRFLFLLGFEGNGSAGRRDNSFIRYIYFWCKKNRQWIILSLDRSKIGKNIAAYRVRTCAGRAHWISSPTP